MREGLAVGKGQGVQGSLHRGWRHGVCGFLLLMGMGTSGLAHAALPGQPSRPAPADPESPGTPGGRWSVLVQDVRGGAPVLSQNATAPQLPASTAKLLTTAYVLHTLGAQDRLLTRVLAQGLIAGRVVGPLIFLGGGDPNLSSRIFPFNGRTQRGPALSPLRDLAEQLWQAGVREVPDGILADSRLFPTEYAPTGWTPEDQRYWYGAPISALSFNDAMVEVLVRPGARSGQRASAEIIPNPLGVIRNAVKTVGAGEEVIPLRLEIVGEHWVLSGSIRARAAPVGAMLAQPDPARFAGLALQQALLDQGIRVTGEVRVRARGQGSAAPQRPFYPGYVVLAQRRSPAIIDAVTVVNKVSENTHAEILLRDADLARGGDGDTHSALARLRDWLLREGVIDQQAEVADACGLSRNARLSAADLVRALAQSYQQPWGALWRASLPVGAEDGTLRHRLEDLPLGTVRAKTGTLRDALALAGLIRGNHGQEYAFAILVDHFKAPRAAIRSRMDDLVRRIALGESAL